MGASLTADHAIVGTTASGRCKLRIKTPSETRLKIECRIHGSDRGSKTGSKEKFEINEGS